MHTSGEVKRAGTCLPAQQYFELPPQRVPLAVRTVSRKDCVGCSYHLTQTASEALAVSNRLALPLRRRAPQRAEFLEDRLSGRA
jgi:hypothetical protein